MDAPHMMPMVDRPKTKPDGSPYTQDDKEFHELAGEKGGIRRYVYQPYPKMLYRGFTTSTGKVELETKIVESEREESEASGWERDPTKALAQVEAVHRAIAQAAAETAHTVETRGTKKAKREYRKRSAATPEHVTE